ncbi:hypothetical protein [Streptacidiphilus jiangxiensis]|uniref:Uncharacterized protein n=1 Tax=Streptacidiphilus jiangxiensis TaxID=235985 RepID=A0A1H8AK54_STRJI|nr:hypothetical protein [Streptacidiphilus jiangxiensis]SEM70374.1 hypothetical protein SAMN05414137_14533 [Streptacidiphilus jiangxiensis]
MTDHRSLTAGNPMSQRAADVLAWALGSPLPDDAERPGPAAPVEDAALADAPGTAAPEEQPEHGPGPHAGIEPPAVPELERSTEESTPTPEPKELAEGGAERPHAAPDWTRSHIGRAWEDTEIENVCPCPQEACGLIDPMRAAPECDQHGPGTAKTMRQGHRADQCPGPRPKITPMEALRQRADRARSELHRLGAVERRQVRELRFTRNGIASARAELSRVVDALLAMVEELAQTPATAPAPAAEPCPAPDQAPGRPAPLAIEPPAHPEARAAEPVGAAEEREALLRVLDNQAADIHPKFGPYGPYPHTRTGEARTDWVASWLGHAPAARFQGEQLTDDGWQRAPLTDPDGETSAFTVARTLATLRNGTPVQWAPDGAVSVPGFRWTPVADCQPLPVGDRIAWAELFTGASAPLTAPDTSWKTEPGWASAAALRDALRGLPADTASVRDGVLKLYARDRVFRFTPRR